MRYSIAILVMCSTIGVKMAHAQKPFSEGTIVYTVELSTPDNKMYKGTYTFLFKNGKVRKELRLDNGYNDITLINSEKSTLYSLQERDGRKYAIQLNIDNDLLKRQVRFRGFTMSGEVPHNTAVCGQQAYRGIVMYKDSIQSEILYSKEWKPDVGYTWNRFPDAQFIPLRFAYKEDNGIHMTFTASKMEASPVLTSVFTIPQDYKMISNEEYRQLSK